MNRREFLYGLNASLGSVAFTSLLAQSAYAANAKQRHYRLAKAKRCIFLYMEGGPSHIDTFDPKQALIDYAGQPMAESVVVRQGHPGPLMLSLIHI